MTPRTRKPDPELGCGYAIILAILVALFVLTLIIRALAS